MPFSSKEVGLLDYLYDSNLLLYALLTREIENLETEDWELKTEIQ